MAKESYQDLIFALGDMARELLPGRPDCPRSMDRVLKAEGAVAQRREELAALEQEMNERDRGFRSYLAGAEAEKAQQAVVVKRYRKAVDAVESKAKGLRKHIASAKAEVRYGNENIQKAQRRHEEWELAMAPAHQLEMSRQNLKKLRLGVMRKARIAEELELELRAVLTPDGSQPGAAGILAHRRLLELKDEILEQKRGLDEEMAALEAAIVKKEQEIQGAEDYLDQAVFLMGEECYRQRLPVPGLSALYARLDKAR